VASDPSLSEGLQGIGDPLPMSPGAARRRLGGELRSLREAAQLRLEDAGGYLQRSPATMSRLESGRGLPRLVEIAALLEYYASVRSSVVTPEVRERVLRLAADGRKKQWFDPFRDVMTGAMTPEHMNRYVELETDASDIRSFQPDLIPGSLQTPDYARAVADVIFPGRSRDQLSRFVEFRIARQRFLDRNPNPLRFYVVIGEAALRRDFGKREVLRTQLESLANEMRGGRPNVSVRIVPITAAVPAVLGGPFVVMSFVGDNETDVVYLESRSGGDYLVSAADVERFLLYFDSAVEASLSTADGLSLVESIARGLD
jgi:transcriptional regulator with XRE-family HTH domain